MHDLLTFLQSVDAFTVYVSVFFIAWLENLFPPSPSDLAIVFAGSLAGLGNVSAAGVLLAATAGSTAGFVTMYGVGAWFGRRILDQGKISFIPPTSVAKAEQWFSRYGMWLIVANRFLAGTRAVVSFFAGMSHLKIGVTALLSFVSALVWNSVLVAAGYALGDNWEKIGFYLTTYSQVITGVVVVVALILAGRYVARRSAGNGRNGGKG